MDEGDDDESGYSARLLTLAAVLLALLNFWSTRQRERYLNPDDALSTSERRARYTVFFGTNTFVFIWIVQILSAAVSVQVLPSAVVSAVCGYAIARALLPDTSEDGGSGHEGEAVEEDMGSAESQELRPGDEEGEEGQEEVLIPEISHNEEQELNQEPPQRMSENKDGFLHWQNPEQGEDSIRELGEDEEHLGGDQQPEIAGDEKLDKAGMLEEDVEAERREDELTVRHDEITKEDDANLQQSPLPGSEPDSTRDQLGSVEHGDDKSDEDLGYIQEEVIEQVAQHDVESAMPEQEEDNVEDGVKGENIGEERTCSDDGDEAEQPDNEHIRQDHRLKGHEPDLVEYRDDDLFGELEAKSDEDHGDERNTGHVEEPAIEQRTQQKDVTPDEGRGVAYVQEEVIGQVSQQDVESAMPEHRQEGEEDTVEQVETGEKIGEDPRELERECSDDGGEEKRPGNEYNRQEHQLGGHEPDLAKYDVDDLSSKLEDPPDEGHGNEREAGHLEEQVIEQGTQQDVQATPHDRQREQVSEVEGGVITGTDKSNGEGENERSDSDEDDMEMYREKQRDGESMEQERSQGLYERMVVPEGNREIQPELAKQRNGLEIDRDEPRLVDEGVNISRTLDGADALEEEQPQNASENRDESPHSDEDLQLEMSSADGDAGQALSPSNLGSEIEPEQEDQGRQKVIEAAEREEDEVIEQSSQRGEEGPMPEYQQDEDDRKVEEDDRRINERGFEQESPHEEDTGVTPGKQQDEGGLRKEDLNGQQGVMPENIQEEIVKEEDGVGWVKSGQQVYQDETQEESLENQDVREGSVGQEELDESETMAQLHAAVKNGEEKQQGQELGEDRGVIEPQNGQEIAVDEDIGQLQATLEQPHKELLAKHEEILKSEANDIEQSPIAEHDPHLTVDHIQDELESPETEDEPAEGRQSDGIVGHVEEQLIGQEVDRVNEGAMRGHPLEGDFEVLEEEDNEGEQGIEEECSNDDNTGRDREIQQNAGEMRQQSQQQEQREQPIDIQDLFEQQGDVTNANQDQKAPKSLGDDDGMITLEGDEEDLLNERPQVGFESDEETQQGQRQDGGVDRSAVQREGEQVLEENQRPGMTVDEQPEQGLITGVEHGTFLGPGSEDHLEEPHGNTKEEDSDLQQIPMREPDDTELAGDQVRDEKVGGEDELNEVPEVKEVVGHVEEQVIEQSIQQVEKGGIPDQEEKDEVTGEGQNIGRRWSHEEDTDIDREEQPNEEKTRQWRRRNEKEETEQLPEEIIRKEDRPREEHTTAPEPLEQRILQQEPHHEGDAVRNIGHEVGDSTLDIHDSDGEQNGIPEDEHERLEPDVQRESTEQEQVKAQDFPDDQRARARDGSEEIVQAEDEPVAEEFIEPDTAHTVEQPIAQSEHPEGKVSIQGKSDRPEEVTDESARLEGSNVDIQRAGEGAAQDQRGDEQEVISEEGHIEITEISEQYQIPEEGQAEIDPFVELLLQLGLDRTSRLGLLDQRTLREDAHPAEGGKRSVTTDFFIQLSAGVPDAAQNLLEHEEDETDTPEEPQRTEEGLADPDKFSSRDALFAILTCCDPFLLQEVLRQLVQCGNAVPVIMPKLDDGPLCLLWGLRKANITRMSSTKHAIEALNVTNTPFITVSAIRLGESGTSKSTVLNTILNDLKCTAERKYFIADDQPCVWSCGAVEAVWCLPSRDKVTEQAPLAFLNLRGDSLEFHKQAEFCIRSSKFIIVFTESSETVDIGSMFRNKSPDTRVILVSPASDVKSPFEGMDNIIHIKTTNCTTDQISQSILEAILGGNLTQVEKKSLQSMSELCKDLDIPIDETLPECNEAKTTATGIIAEMRGKSKEDLFPLHHLWKQWVEVNNETLGEHNIEHELSKILQKKREIRSSQQNVELPKSMDAFVKSLTADSDQKYYTYIWLDLLLGQHSDDSPQGHTDFDEGGNPAQTPGIVNSIDITDFQQELGQMVECEHPRLEQEQVPGDEPIFEYFSELQRNGVPIVLFDSDACAVPLEWLEDAFDNLDESPTGSDPRVCVVSIIGRPKSFKTTLLNRLFGVNFSTRPPVSSKGMLLHLVPVAHPAKEQIGCDYVLIIDTQSFDLVNEPSSEDLERHEYITTLTLCISDLVIVNSRQIRDESGQESKLLDPSFVRGLIKMREVNKSGKCCLVQHCDADLIETTDRGALSAQLFERAKRDLSEEVRSEREEDVGEDLLDVFSLEKENQAIVIPYAKSDLEPSPSEQNCQQVIALRDVILQFVAQCNRSQMSFVDFYQRIADVTNALKKEEFVKDFRDTNLENLKDEFVLWYRDLLLKLKSDLTSRLAVSCNELSKTPIENFPEAKNAATKELTKEVEDEFGKVKVQVKEQLQSREYESLSDQEDYFQQDIDSAKEAFLPKIEESFERVLKQAEQTKKLTKGLQKEGGEFLAALSQKTQPESSVKSVENEFEREQDEFLKRLKRKYPLHKMDVIHQNTEDNMKYMLMQCGEEVEALLANEPLSDHVDGHSEMSSIDDVKALSDGFNVPNSAAERAFERAKDILFDLSENPEIFHDSSKEFIQLLKGLEGDFATLVENVTMYLFILAKFISEMNESHLKREMSQLCSPEWDDAEKLAKMQEIEQKVKSDAYRIEHAEPLDLPTIDAKISSVLSSLRDVCSDQEMVVLGDVFTSKNVRNCAALPFDLITLQRLDRCFICMLPSLEAEDVKSINETVNEAKMKMLGKVFAKQRFDHGKAFNEMYSLVQKAIIDDKEEGKRTRAAALVHLSAWSTPVVDVKKLEDLKAENVANTFEKEQGKICLVLLKSRCGHNCDDLIADIVYDEIEESLSGLVEESIVTRLREYFLLEAGVLNTKRTFIGNVLRDLCLKVDYLGFANFLKNYNEFGEKWILNFIANECNTVDDSLLDNLLREVVDAQTNQIGSVIEETIVEFGRRPDQNLPTWLQIFQAKFSDQFKTSCRVNTIEILENSTNVEQFDNFTGRLTKNLDEMKLKLERSITLPTGGNAGDTKVWLLSLSHEIHVELAAVVRGCIEQCPFCGAACENTLGEHESHETVLHYPGGVKGWHDVKSLKLFTDICTSAVASSQQYRTPDEQFRPYREFKKDHPKWEIPGKIGEPMEFWQYVFNKFNGQFARHYSCQKGDVPVQWSHITKEEAVRSVEKAYKLNPVILEDNEGMH